MKKIAVILICLLNVSGLGAMSARRRECPVLWNTHEQDLEKKADLEEGYQELHKVMLEQHDLMAQCEYWQAKMSRALKSVPAIGKVDLDDPQSVAQFKRDFELFKKCDAFITRVGAIKQGLRADIDAGNADIAQIVQECKELKDQLGSMPW